MKVSKSFVHAMLICAGLLVIILLIYLGMTPEQVADITVYIAIILGILYIPKLIKYLREEKEKRKKKK